jgi:hypothetical protein
MLTNIVPASQKLSDTQHAYQEYLQSDKWQFIRRLILARDGHKCVDCSSTEDLHVHHIRYSKWGEELPEDLVTLCKKCHDREHGYSEDLSWQKRFLEVGDEVSGEGFTGKCYELPDSESRITTPAIYANNNPDLANPRFCNIKSISSNTKNIREIEVFYNVFNHVVRESSFTPGRDLLKPESPLGYLLNESFNELLLWEIHFLQEEINFYIKVLNYLTGDNMCSLDGPENNWGLFVPSIGADFQSPTEMIEGAIFFYQNKGEGILLTKHSKDLLFRPKSVRVYDGNVFGITSQP